MQGQGDNQRALLEKTASELTHATECFAKEELTFSLERDSPRPKFYMPLIVTNAKLTVCSFVPHDIDINTGELSLENAHFDTVPYIRFQKGLETNILGSKLQIGLRQALELKEVNAEKERTVFVVNSENLLSFFKDCSVTPNIDEMRFPWEDVDNIYYSLPRS